MTGARIFAVSYQLCWVAGVRLARPIVAMTLALLVSTCGFHLRGSTNLPPALGRIEVQGLPQNDPLTLILNRQLRARGASVVAREEATAILNVISNEQGRRVLSVNSQGKVREFQLFYALSYELTPTAAQFPAEQQNINLVREFIFDQDDVLGKSSEEALLFEDMRNDAIRLLMRRLESVGG